MERQNEAGLVVTSIPRAEPAWELFHSNRTAWTAAFGLCESARHSIAIEQYIFSRKGVGDDLLDLLASRAREGLRVRVLADAFGSQHLIDSAPAKALRKAGGEVVHFHGLRDFVRDPRTLMHRLHRKAVICDDDSLLTGGSCFSPRMVDWRDTMVRVDGLLAREALAAFDATWSAAEGGRGLPQIPVRELDPRAWSYLVSWPKSPAGNEYYRLLLEQIGAAQASVVLTTPYFLPDKIFVQCLLDAAARGVRVRLLLPAHSDHPMVDRISSIFTRKLTQGGVEVHGYLPAMMHAKLVIIDAGFAAVGSFNLGLDSFRMNLEGAVATASPDFIYALTDQLELDFSVSKRM
ncbi:phospholipase D-like domain-containing protein [Devosia nitrariae]|uniref:Phospholipase D n=1 Tax=Devosia nitrariae TaxID=2071872 RepID=A0ABQ5W536_9HYPH|nr:phospholipase D-like domain-containing protein [Devosia nitrariae]GLQ54745.1 hypothetical protein GCM10010862_20040 [Devosia nitrariae]